jgi:hypothetical protein
MTISEEQLNKDREMLIKSLAKGVRAFWTIYFAHFPEHIEHYPEIYRSLHGKKEAKK